MPPDAVIVLSDAHLGEVPDEVEAALHRFLRVAPTLADHVIVNGDLFGFWFEYRAAIPRRAFPTLAALWSLQRAGVRLTIVGGNHDRFGGAFWREQMGAAFHPDGVTLSCAGRTALVAHGDGIGDADRGARLLRRVTGHRLTRALFRAIHPDLGLRLVERFGPVLARRPAGEADRQRAARAQAAHARRLLAERPELSLVILGHTHVPALEAAAPGRWYVNPGAWMDGRRYARITREGPELAVFEG